MLNCWRHAVGLTRLSELTEQGPTTMARRSRPSHKGRLGAIAVVAVFLAATMLIVKMLAWFAA